MMVTNEQIRNALLEPDYIEAVEKLGFKFICFDEDSSVHIFANDKEKLLYYSPAEEVCKIFKFEREVDIK